MGMYHLGPQQTNIDPSSEMADRLQKVNSNYIGEFAVVGYPMRERVGVWPFRKWKSFTLYEVIDNVNYAILLELVPERHVEIYLLGLLNGVEGCRHGWFEIAK